MKRFIRLLTFIAIIPWMACTKDTTPPVVEPVKRLLTLTVDASYATTATDNWVMVHDINGKLLEFHPFETGDTIVVKKTQDISGNKINVTLVRYDGAAKYLNLQSYLFNDIEQVWTLSVPVNPPKESKIGQFDVVVNGMPEGSSYQFSNQTHDLFGNGLWNAVTQRLDLRLDVHANSSDCFFHFADPAGNPKYTVIENVQSGQQYNISTNLMKDYDSKLLVSFPPTISDKIAFTVNNIKPGQPNPKAGFVINGNFLTRIGSVTFPRSSVTLGYLDRYTNYLTTLSVEYGNRLKYYYDRLGTKPDKIEFPLKDSFSLTNKDISQYRFQHNKPFLQRNGLWIYRGNGLISQWEVYAAADATQVYPEIPAELATRFSMQLSPDKFAHEFSTFTVHGDTYDDRIDLTFKGKSRLTSYENYRIQIW